MRTSAALQNLPPAPKEDAANPAPPQPDPQLQTMVGQGEGAHRTAAQRASPAQRRTAVQRPSAAARALAVNLDRVPALAASCQAHKVPSSPSSSVSTAFIDDDKPKLAAVGNVREYHQWSWTDPSGAAFPNNPLEFSRWQGFWDFDDYYRTLRDAGAFVVPCLQGSVSFLGDRMPPVPENADPTQPASYAAHASFVFQYAARYGATKVPDSLLNLAPDQVVASGLGYLRYFENGNEPDADWIHPDGSFLFEPEATAAMSSADYDGHQGALGPTAGIKNADPASNLVLAGLAGSGPNDWANNITAYFDRIRIWATTHRAGSFPADVLNVHYYCFGPDPFDAPNPRPALSPEACDLRAS